MRYILDVSGHDLKLIRASIVNFQRSLELSEQADFDSLIDELDDCFLSITRQKKVQLKSKLKENGVVKNEMSLLRTYQKKKIFDCKIK